MICQMKIVALLRVVLVVLISSSSSVEAYGPEPSKPGTIVVEPPTNGETYLLLSDDELIHNSELLDFLSKASKEDVEEVTNSSPAVQEALVDRVQDVVHLRQVQGKEKGKADYVLVDNKASQRLGKDFVDSYSSNFGYGNSSVYQNNSGFGKGNGPGGLAALGKPSFPGVAPGGMPSKLQMLKKKLGSKAAKLFKIGGKFKKKLMKFQNRNRRGWRRRRPNQNNRKPQYDGDYQRRPTNSGPPLRPNFHFEVNSS